MKSISIIIPTYNEKGNIGRLLENLLKMTDSEIIVSDGNSTDGTGEVCRKFPIKYISGPSGRGAQLNAGAELATGDILLFLHADSQIEKQAIKYLVQAIKKGYRWGCLSLNFDDRSIFFKLVAWASRLRVQLTSSCYGDQGLFCERNLFYAAGRYPEIPILEDLCISKQLKKKAGKAYVLSGRIITSSRRFKEGGKLRTLAKMQFVKILFLLGIPPQRLNTIYRRTKEEQCNQQSL